MVTAFGQAVEQASVAPARLSTVFGSAYGETATLLSLLWQLQADEHGLSPMQFAGSVHNTASGATSIAVGATGFTTSLAAGSETFGACLCEAAGLLTDGHASVAVVVGDCRPPAGLVPVEDDFDTLVTALVLEPPGAAQALAHVEELRLAPSAGPCAQPPARLGLNPCVGGLLLVDAIVGGREGELVLDATPRRSNEHAWCLRLTQVAHAQVSAHGAP